MKITALEISKNLPMRVKTTDDKKGMFAGETIRFYEVNNQGYLIGHVVGNKGKRICVIDPNSEFETLH